MKSQIKALIAIVLISGLSQVFAADTDTSWATASWDTQTANIADVNADDLDASALSDEEEDAAIDDLWTEAPLDAASWKDIVAAPKGWVGNYVEVAHENGFKSKYAHMGKIYVKTGQKVTSENILGEVGMSGNTSGPHTHLEITREEKYLDPLTLLPSPQDMPFQAKITQ